VKLPWLSAREVLKVLIRNGFIIKRQIGSHIQLVGIVKNARQLVTVPYHGNEDLAPGTLLSIIEQSGFTKEEFLNLIR